MLVSLRVITVLDSDSVKSGFEAAELNENDSVQHLRPNRSLNEESHKSSPSQSLPPQQRDDCLQWLLKSKPKKGGYSNDRKQVSNGESFKQHFFTALVGALVPQTMLSPRFGK